MADMGYSWEELVQAVSEGLGYTRDASGDDRLDAEHWVTAGQRLFYNPPPLGGVIHRWRFLRPIRYIETVADTECYDMPDDFGDVIGDMYHDASQGYAKLPKVGPGMILELKQGISSAGKPRCFSIEPLETDGGDIQFFQARFWPMPNAVYKFWYRAQLIPALMSESRQYGYGGADHAETLKAACMAAAEMIKDGEQGPKYAYFLECLQRSIAVDVSKGPDYFGYAGDRSDEGTQDIPRCLYVTYNGVKY